MILPQPSQLPLLNLKTQAKKNLSIYSNDILIRLGTSSSPPNSGHTPPTLSSSSWFFHHLWSSPTLQHWPSQQTPTQFSSCSTNHRHPLFNCNNRWAHGGLRVEEALATAVSYSERMVGCFLCKKSFQQKNTSKQKIAQGVENKQLLSQRIISQVPAQPTFFGSTASIPYKQNQNGLPFIYT